MLVSKILPTKFVVKNGKKNGKKTSKELSKLKNIFKIFLYQGRSIRSFENLFFLTKLARNKTKKQNF